MLFFSFEDPSKEFFIRVFTESLLVQFMTPDFSMPYIVIFLTSALVSLALAKTIMHYPPGGWFGHYKMMQKAW